MNTLEFEHKWLAVLIILQLIKTAIITVWQSCLAYQARQDKFQAMFTEEDLSDLNDIEFQEEDLKAFNVDRLTFATEMSINQLV